MIIYDKYGQAHEVSEEDIRNADRVASWSSLSQLPFEARVANARAYGENWASILSGCGDQ